MEMNNPNTTLKDCIHNEKGIIPADLCEYIIKDTETREWKPHTWYNYEAGSYASEETMELDVQPTTKELQDLLTPIIIKAGAIYNQKYTYPSPRTDQIMTKFTGVRFNRYRPGQIMRYHHDHIHSIFDGKEKGIPVLSFILNFNDTYEGAKLFFWDDYAIDFGVGDICMWPSPWLWPHGVTEATSGTRYSAVCWGW